MNGIIIKLHSPSNPINQLSAIPILPSHASQYCSTSLVYFRTSLLFGAHPLSFASPVSFFRVAVFRCCNPTAVLLHLLLQFPLFFQLIPTSDNATWSDTLRSSLLVVLHYTMSIHVAGLVVSFLIQTHLPVSIVSAVLLNQRLTPCCSYSPVNGGGPLTFAPISLLVHCFKENRLLLFSSFPVSLLLSHDGDECTTSRPPSIIYRPDHHQTPVILNHEARSSGGWTRNAIRQDTHNNHERSSGTGEPPKHPPSIDPRSQLLFTIFIPLPIRIHHDRDRAERNPIHSASCTGIVTWFMEAGFSWPSLYKTFISVDITSHRRLCRQPELHWPLC